jgi:hypothetical protein
MKDKLRLILFEECNKKCVGCCNNDFDIKNLPIEKDFSGYNKIFLTGGEPMLKPDVVVNTINMIREQNKTAKIGLYTSLATKPKRIIKILSKIDSFTLTIHENKDVIPFLILSSMLLNISQKNKAFLNKKSMRLNVFKEATLLSDPISIWNLNNNKDAYSLWNIIKLNIEWIKNCPLPAGEVLKRL